MKETKAQKIEKTGAEVAAEQRQSKQLDEEIGKSEKSFKALARGKLGAKSLIGNKTGSPIKGPTDTTKAPKKTLMK